MNTIETVKQRLIDHLAGMNLDKMSTDDLARYAGIVGQIKNMDKPDYMETLAKTMYGMNCHSASGCEKTEEVS